MAGLTPQGFVPATAQELRVIIGNALKANLGGDIDTNPSSRIGQFIDIVATELESLWLGLEAVYDSQFPNSASGVSLDNIGSLTNTPRNPGSGGLVQVYFGGQLGATVASGTIVAHVNGFELATKETRSINANSWIAYTDLIPTSDFTDADVEILEAAFLQEEQVDCPVRHHFGPGVYIREVVLPAGSYIIGHRHNSPHLNVMLEGRLTLINADGTRTELAAPQTFIAPAGRKIEYIHETVRWQNIYATEETDVETLETQLLDKSVAFEEAQKNQLLMQDFSTAVDQDDFVAAIAEYGFDEATVWAMSEDETDQMPMPHGEYKMMVSASRIHGKGVFASADIAAHELIAPARLGGKRTPAGRFTNHSKTPNAEMVLSDNGDIFLFANQMISGCKGGSVGEEITVDYRQALSLSVGEP